MNARHLHSTLTRRQMLAGTTAAMAATAGSRFVRPAVAQDATPAATPVAQPDRAGAVHAFQVGAFNCLAVSDGASVGPVSESFTFMLLPPEESIQALTEAGFDPNAIENEHTSTVIDTGDQLVLVDTGFGPEWPGPEGLLLQNLQGEGISPEDIDVVIITHGHGDHIGGNADADGNPIFPNARYVMSQEDWEFWTDEATVTEAIPAADFRELLLGFVRQHLSPLEDRFELIGYDEEIVPGITSIAAQGHTPGHMALLVQSEGEQLWIAGDAALHPVQLAHPEFVGLPDVEPARMIETRRRLLSRMADEGGLASFFHFAPFPSLGHVLPEGEVWTWEPVPDEAATPAL